MGKPLNWQPEIIWDKQEFPDADYVEVMDSLFISKEDAVDGIRTFKTSLLNYRYSWFDRDMAARKGGKRKNFVQTEMLNVYPDTTVWVKASIIRTMIQCTKIISTINRMVNIQ